MLGVLALLRDDAFAADANDDLLRYPSHSLLAVMNGLTDVSRVVDSLANAGFSLDQLEVLHGSDGIRRIGMERHGNGLVTSIKRWLPELGPERRLFEEYAQELRNGHVLVVIRGVAAQTLSQVLQIMLANGGHHVRYFGRFVVHLVSP